MRGYPVIDSARCTLCTLCVAICPKEILEKKDGRISVTGLDCMLCSHCHSICPEDAISFDSLDLVDVTFPGIRGTDTIARPGEIDPAQLIRFLRSRRSTRRYRKKAVPGSLIENLLRCAVLAPSGSNCQAWEFTVINDREKVWNLALRIGSFFRRLNRLAANPLLRWISVPFMGTALVRYNRDHRQTVEWAIAEADRGRDLLFHGAPCLLVFHSPVEGSTPSEDIQYASYHVALLAHSMGLGSCYIGFATEALNRMSSLRSELRIPDANRIYSVMTLGYPAVFFRKGALRKPWKEYML